MSEEVIEQTSETPPVSEQVEAPSLDSLYGEFNQQTQPVQSNTQQFTQPEVRTQGSFNGVPDPVIDSEGFQQYMGNINNELAAARSEAYQLKTELSQEKQALAAQAEERDFRNIAGEIAKNSGIDTDLVEASLLHKYVKDPAFQNMYHNRESNLPAFEKVKSALSQEMRKKFEYRVDPQQAENQRAVEEISKGTSSSKTDEDDFESRLMKMPAGEFDIAIRNLKGS